jgi:hypothetical protein
MNYPKPNRKRVRHGGGAAHLERRHLEFQHVVWTGQGPGDHGHTFGIRGRSVPGRAGGRRERRRTRGLEDQHRLGTGPRQNAQLPLNMHIDDAPGDLHLDGSKTEVGDSSQDAHVGRHDRVCLAGDTPHEPELGVERRHT